MRIKFIEECRHWWKLWSSWLAIAFGGIGTAIWNDPGMFSAAANSLPAETRALLSPIVWLVLAGLPVLVRMLKQPKLKEPADGEK